MLARLKYIRNVAVFAGKEPSGVTMVKTLQDGRYMVFPAKGRIGGIDNLYAVFNISLDTMKYYCRKYQQPSFVFTELIGDTVANYYIKQKGTYVISDTVKGSTDLDYCLMISGEKFTFKIPQTILCNCNIRVISNYYKAENKSIIRHKSLSYCVFFATERVGFASFIMRSVLNKKVNTSLVLDNARIAYI